MKSLSLLPLRINLLEHLQQRLNSVQVIRPETAKWICWLIPDRCPFERRIYLMGHLIGSIPPLCQLNPFYKQFIALRLKALMYLAAQEE